MLKVPLRVGFFFLTTLFIVETGGVVGGVQLASHSALCCKRFPTGEICRGRLGAAPAHPMTWSLWCHRSAGLLALNLVMEVGVLHVIRKRLPSTTGSFDHLASWDSELGPEGPDHWPPRGSFLPLKSLNLSLPHFSHTSNGDPDNTYLTALLLDVTRHMEMTQSTAHHIISAT